MTNLNDLLTKLTTELSRVKGRPVVDNLAPEVLAARAAGEPLRVKKEFRTSQGLHEQGAIFEPGDLSREQLARLAGAGFIQPDARYQRGRRAAALQAVQSAIEADLRAVQNERTELAKAAGALAELDGRRAALVTDVRDRAQYVQKLEGDLFKRLQAEEILN